MQVFCSLQIAVITATIFTRVWYSSGSPCVIQGNQDNFIYLAMLFLNPPTGHRVQGFYFISGATVRYSVPQKLPDMASLFFLSIEVISGKNVIHFKSAFMIT